MGVNHSEDAAESFQRADWDLLEGTQNERVTLWVNRHDPNLRVQQFQLFPENQKEFDRQKEMYYFRKNSAHLVAALFLQNQEQGDFCSSSYRQKLFLETIPIRLSDIEHIPFPDYLHLLSQCLRGFQELAREVGCFSVEEEYIGINNNGVVKVWMNQHFERSFAVGATTITEEIMVRCLIDLIVKNMDQNQLPNNLPSIRNYLYRNADTLKFDSAIREFDQFVREYNRGEVPPKLDCIDRVGGISAITNRNWTSLKYDETEVERPIFVQNNYQQQVTGPQFQRPQLIDGQLNGQFASSFVRPVHTNQVNFVPMRDSEIIRQGQIVDPSVIRQNLPVVRGVRPPMQIMRDSRNSSQRVSQIVTQPLPASQRGSQIVTQPLPHSQRGSQIMNQPLGSQKGSQIINQPPQLVVVGQQNVGTLQPQNRHFVGRSQVITSPMILHTQQPPIQGRQLHFEQHPQFIQQAPTGLIYSPQPPPQTIQHQVNHVSIDSSALRRDAPVATYIYSSVKSPEQVQNVPINETSQRSASVSVNEFNGAVEKGNANNNSSSSVEVGSNSNNVTVVQQYNSNAYGFNIQNNNDLASKIANAGQEKEPIIGQAESSIYTPIYNFNTDFNFGSSKQPIPIVQSNPNTVQSPSKLNFQNNQYQQQPRSNFKENNASNSPYKIPTYQYSGKQTEDINVSFNPKAYVAQGNYPQSFKKKQSYSSSTYKADFSMDDGKSSDDFLRKLRQMGSPTAMKLDSEFSPSFKKGSENSQARVSPTRVSPTREQNTNEAVPVARQLNIYEAVPNQGSSYTYGQSFQYSPQQQQPSYSQNSSTTIHNSASYDDQFGRNVQSNIVSQQQFFGQTNKSRQVIGQPMKFEQNLDMKYSVVSGEEPEASKFKYSSYSPHFDPELLADMGSLGQYS